MNDSSFSSLKVPDKTGLYEVKALFAGGLNYIASPLVSLV